MAGDYNDPKLALFEVNDKTGEKVLLDCDYWERHDIEDEQGNPDWDLLDSWVDEVVGRHVEWDVN